MATLHLSRGEADDRLPLLSNEEGVLEDNEEDIEVEFRHGKSDGPRSLLEVSNSTGVMRHGASFSADRAAPSSRKRKHYSGSEMIVAVFVVAFDTKKGDAYRIDLWSKMERTSMQSFLEA